uniref:Uncharacterized protein n=1 Tax=Anguilla anguilla TaxID=7936 RepID=A0A0E9QG73_ANGAN
MSCYDYKISLKMQSLQEIISSKMP